MRKITRHIIHASASPNGRDIGVNEIRQWHLERGFNDIGYHFVIRRNGKIETGRRLERVGAHVQGHNADSIGTCLVGAGVVLGDFTPEQIASLQRLHKQLLAAFPNLSLHGHREYANKLCPGFDIKDLENTWNQRPLTKARRLSQTGPKRKVK